MTTIHIPYKPQPRQAKYHQANNIDELLYGGAAGGGKSEATIWDALKYALQYQGSRQIIFRRTFPDLQRSIIMRTMQVYPKEVGKYNQAKHEWTYVNGSIIELAYWDNDSNYMNYQGAEYDVIRWEELTQFEERWYIYMLSRLRGSKPYPRSVKSTTNPGGVGHSWVKRRFIDIGPSEQVHHIHETDDSGNPLFDHKGAPVISRRIFIPANVFDNQALIQNDPGYLTRLQMLPDAERKQLLEGDWDSFAGQYFSEFNRAIHVIEPFAIPPEWKRFRMMDEGYNDPFVCLWGALDHEGNLYIYRELIQSKLLSSEQAQKVKDMTPEGERIDYSVGDTSFWNKGKADGKAPYEVFAEMGVPMIQATKERVNGWKRVREWLHVFDDTDPVSGQRFKNAHLKIFSNCRGLIEALPSMVVDDTHPEDVAEHPLDHAPDALRYGLMSRPSPRRIKPDDSHLSPQERWMKQMDEKHFKQTQRNRRTVGMR